MVTFAKAFDVMVESVSVNHPIYPSALLRSASSMQNFRNAVCRAKLSGGHGASDR